MNRIRYPYQLEENELKKLICDNQMILCKAFAFKFCKSWNISRVEKMEEIIILQHESLKKLEECLSILNKDKK